MITHGNAIEIISGNSNRPLAEAVAAELGLSLSDAEGKGKGRFYYSIDFRPRKR